MPWYLIAALAVVTLAVVWWTWKCHTMRRKLYSNSRTLFWARWTEVAGWILMVWEIVLPALSANQFSDALPGSLQAWWPIVLIVLGRAFDRLRQETTKSIERRRVEP